MLLTSFFVVHDTLVGGENDEAELTRGQDGADEVFELSEGEIEAGGDDSTLVQTSVEFDNNLAGSGIINDFEFVDVAVLLHAAEELDEDLGDGAEEHLYKVPDEYLGLKGKYTRLYAE